MKKSRFTDSQIIAVLKQAAACCIAGSGISPSRVKSKSRPHGNRLNRAKPSYCSSALT